MKTKLLSMSSYEKIYEKTGYKIISSDPQFFKWEITWSQKKYDPEAILALFLLSQWNCSSLYWWNSGKCMILTEENSWTIYYGSSKLQMKFWISLVWGNQWIKSSSYFLFLQMLVLLRSPTFAKVFFFAQLVLIKAEA